MKTIRKLHFWIGTLFAPTIIFFALSGAFQVAGLHEGADAAPWIAKLAQIHKNQTIDDPPARKAAPRPTSDAPKPSEPPRAGPHRSQLLVIWFILMSIGLLGSTCLGVYMAFAYKRDRIVIVSLLAAGIAIPVIGMFV